MKQFIIATLSILSIAVFIYLFSNMESYTINKLSTYSEFERYSNTLSMQLDSTDAETMLGLKEKYYEQLFPPTSDVCIFEVEAGITYTQKGSSYIQDAIIKRVIQGEDSLCNKQINLVKTGGIVTDEESNNKVYIDTTTCVNIMKPGSRYLVFCEKSKASDTLNPHIPEYQFIFAKFALLNIDKDDHVAISDYDIEGDSSYTMYKKYKNQEFFTASQETLSAFIEIKHEIFEQYDVKR